MDANETLPLVGHSGELLMWVVLKPDQIVRLPSKELLEEQLPNELDMHLVSYDYDRLTSFYFWNRWKQLRSSEFACVYK